MELTEKQFEAQVKDLAKFCGYKYYHTWRSIHSPAGFPDCVLVKVDKIIFAELKAEKGKLSPAQQEWIDILKEYEQEIFLNWPTNDLPFAVYVWRPSQIKEIVEILRK